MKTMLLMVFAALSFQTATIDKKLIDTSKSTIEWEGKKVTGKHTGTINIKEGALEFDNNTLVGGTFIIDMTSITVTDLQGDMAEKLRGHLSSDDFFGVQNFPDANLVINSAIKNGSSYDVEASLTIKGVTAPIQFVATVEGSTAKASLVVDRTKYDVKYRSGKFFDSLGDKMIYDDFTLNVSLGF